MATGQEVIEASELLDESLDLLEINRSRWLLEIIVDNEENEWGGRLLRRRATLGKLLSWPRRKVPEQMVSRYILETLGIDFLRIKQVREVLLSHLNSTSSKKFQSLSDLLVTHGAESQSLPHLADVDFRMGTSLSQTYCELIGLPSSFAFRGSSDSREPMELVHSVKRLHSLMNFQEKIQELSEETFGAENGRAMIVMPTGSGKTRTSIEAALTWLLFNSEWPMTLIWIADREELCEQAYQSFKQIFVHVCQELQEQIEIPEQTKIWRYWGSIDKNSSRLTSVSVVDGIIVNYVQQLQARMRSSDDLVEQILRSPSIVIADEVHRNLDFIEELDTKFRTNQCNTRMFGLTATPMRRQRAETTRLLELFQHNILCPIDGAEHDIDVMTSKLTERKILAERINVDPYQLIDYSTLTNQSGERAYLEKVVHLIYKVREMGRKSILVFTRDVEHARIIASCLRLQSELISAQFLDNKTPTKLRKNIIQQFKSGEIEVLLNYGILTTGFDAPNTDAVIISRPMEPDGSLFRQMVGRGLRGTEFGGTKDCVIVHFEEEY